MERRTKKEKLTIASRWAWLVAKLTWFSQPAADRRNRQSTQPHFTCHRRIPKSSSAGQGCQFLPPVSEDKTSFYQRKTQPPTVYSHYASPTGRLKINSCNPMEVCACAVTCWEGRSRHVFWKDDSNPVWRTHTHTHTEVTANFVDYVQFFFRFQWSVVIQITLELIFNAIYTL